ncbi:tRNA dimethylallyltransferase [Thermoclostridium stercorarium subsp. thermolacticum DSM 2910]|nr:tRNA (adenosine(37)-N6)-dimethylallyltransferase MiaA [Thermoclostridium stercorarium]AGI38918.1 tRNA dimethylallyltransferase [Thermoclostridium stercorarium subsp. stercorarium DSM 8532]ANW98287.1 tRNA dimethylallyltransferase [Thermoclostridium stercorarium subsp. thermolacticum DSM 2910]ANX00811.1 tRNA dimethylallyltransferase [Thermoclostridium stercorarium subsp. leptospartum DSM 9219]
MDKTVIVIAGPTASGKTDLAINLALETDGEVVSADSMQIYRYMDIGTAKPTKEEMRGIPHHMIDIVDPGENYSVALYKRDAENCIRDILSRGKLPIVAGGTGLYINSLIYNIKFGETVIDEEFRERMRKIAETEGPKVLHEMLEKVDPESAAKIHYNNVKRVIRALEVYEYTKKPISQHQKESRTEPPEFRYLVFILSMDRERLYDRINRRVDKMIQKGLVDEVRRLLKMGYKPGSTALQGLGYKEIIRFLNNELPFEEAIRILKRDTRHFAKRQLTWFRAIKEAVWLEGGEENLEKNTKKIQEYLETSI